MANEISSQITAIVQKVNKPAATERASAPVIQAVEVVGKRQDVAADNSVSSVANLVSNNGEEVVASRAELEQAVSDINAYVQTVNRELQFRVDEALPLGRAVVTVIDADTEETIREFPSKEALALAHRLKEVSSETAQSQIEGLIISAHA